MKLFISLLATSAVVVNADGKSAAARFNRLGRQLSFAEIAGYKPGSSVTDHCALDLDQKAMEDQLSLMTPISFAKAREIYNKGGHSKTYAKIDLTTGLKGSIKQGDEILGRNEAGTQISGKAARDYDTDDQELKIYYSTTDIPETYVGCRVGALPNPMLDGCFVDEGYLTIAGEEYAYVYEPKSGNHADRTLAGFSTGAKDKMRTGCKGCPYKDFQAFYDYYGKDDYGHHWIESAFEGKATSFTRGDADFSQYGNDGKEQVIKKGTAYLNVFMYVIREFEDALDDCELESMDNNYDAVHAWDEGVCFYAGSIEGTDGKGKGKFLHELADKRCKNFKTCGENGDGLEGMAKLNHELFDLFAIGNHQLGKGECSTARKTVKTITDKLYIPMIQGTLRYAYKVDKLQGGEVENAEGAVFAAAVLPKIHAISPETASVIYRNMKVGSASTSSKEVKKAFESVYPQMGITCAEMGGLWFDGQETYYEGMEPCGDAADDLSSAGYQLEFITSFCISILLFFSL